MSSKYAYQLIPEAILLEDLGEQIRKQVKKLTNPAILTNDETERITKQIDALERLTSNKYALQYKRTFHSTATGLTAEQCSQVLSSEFLKYLNDEKSSNKKSSN